jgi:hypothetical protein
MKNDGTVVEWGDNSSGQTNIPNLPPNTYIPTPPYPGAPFPGYAIAPPIVFKAIAAGGNHTMACIFSPLVQYQINVAQDLLLIYNSTNISQSSNVCAYYLTNRPMVGNANLLGMSGPTDEVVFMSNYTSWFSASIMNWLASNPTKRPQYVILFQDLPSRLYTDDGSLEVSVQYDMNTGYNTFIGTNNYPKTWNPFVTSINMNGTNGAADCIAYIDKLVAFGSNYSPGKLIISASCGVYSNYNNTNWYFDYAGGPPTYELGYNVAITAEYGVTNVDPTAFVIGTTGLGYDNVANYSAQATNVAAYFTGGQDAGGDATLFVDGKVRFYGQSGWYIMSTIDSTSGQRNSFQDGFLSWFTTNSFGGTNYSNTPVGGITYVDEPNGNQFFNRSGYYGNWAAGKTFAIAATAVKAQFWPVIEFQAIGDPFVRK